jgi:hypothetical protein
LPNLATRGPSVYWRGGEYRNGPKCLAVFTQPGAVRGENHLTGGRGIHCNKTPAGITPISRSTHGESNLPPNAHRLPSVIHRAHATKALRRCGRTHRGNATTPLAMRRARPPLYIVTRSRVRRRTARLLPQGQSVPCGVRASIPSGDSR